MFTHIPVIHCITSRRGSRRNQKALCLIDLILDTHLAIFHLHFSINGIKKPSKQGLLLLLICHMCSYGAWTEHCLGYMHRLSCQTVSTCRRDLFHLRCLRVCWWLTENGFCAKLKALCVCSSTGCCFLGGSGSACHGTSQNGGQRLL